MKQYILDENFQPKECPSIVEWGKWFENRDNLRVKLDHIKDMEISTVFLGIDHGFGKRPVLWETMVFDKTRRELDCDRCSGSYHDAVEMHEKMLKKYKDLFCVTDQFLTSTFGASSKK